MSNNYKNYKTDPRIVRTRAALINALIELMDEEHFNSITVNDLVERAQITRGTFYKHFNDKADFINKITNDIIQDFLDFEKQFDALPPEEAVYHRTEYFFEFIAKNSGFFKVMFGENGLQIVRIKLHEACMKGLYKRYNVEKKSLDCDVYSIEYYENTINSQMEVRIFLNYAVSAIIGVAEFWLRTGMKQSHTYLAKVVNRYVYAIAKIRLEMLDESR